MMGGKLKFINDKRWVGVLVSVLLTAVFVAISLGVNRFIHSTPWFLFSSFLRLLFGSVILLIIKKIYHISISEIFSFKNAKDASVAAIGFIVYFLYYVVLVCIGVKGIGGLTVGLLISKVILQQLTTGFYEELNYRFLICRGCFYSKRGLGTKLIYALCSAAIFGGLHVITGWDTYTFLQTGAIGFAFAVIYLQSENIVLPMALHFVYDVIANMTGFVEWNHSVLFTNMNSVFEVMIAIMFILAAVMLMRNRNNL